MPEPSAEAVISYVMISVVYLVASLMALMFAPRDVKLIAVGIITAVAAIGYAGLVVAGGAAMVSTTLMKLAVLLILGGLALRFLDSAPASAVGEGPRHD